MNFRNCLILLFCFFTLYNCANAQMQIGVRAGNEIQFYFPHFSKFPDDLNDPEFYKGIFLESLVGYRVHEKVLIEGCIGVSHCARSKTNYLSFNSNVNFEFTIEKYVKKNTNYRFYLGFTPLYYVYSIRNKIDVTSQTDYHSWFCFRPSFGLNIEFGNSFILGLDLSYAHSYRYKNNSFQKFGIGLNLMFIKNKK